MMRTKTRIRVFKIMLAIMVIILYEHYNRYEGHHHILNNEYHHSLQERTQLLQQIKDKVHIISCINISDYGDYDV